MGTKVVGVDFGTLSVRVSIVDSQRGRLGSATAPYEIVRVPGDPDHATQRHEDHMRALAEAVAAALADAGVAGSQVSALAIDTTGSTVVPVGDDLVPLGDYYLWCDHRAKEEAAAITRVAHEEGLPHIDWCGGVYSSEWGFSKLLHWLRHHPDQRDGMVTALEHCDLVGAVLCGITDAKRVTRSICAAGHKWMWNEALGGLPPEDFWVKVDPLLAGVREKLLGPYGDSLRLQGRLCSEWAQRLGLKVAIPIPVGAFDAHWDAVGAGIREGDVVNVVGTSSCIMAIAKDAGLIPGVCGVVKGSIHPHYFGIEAGMSATGGIFDVIATRAGRSVADLSEGLEAYRAGQTGLLRMTWDNGDRTVLVNPRLGGATLGWTLTSSVQDELFAAVEGTAFHTRIILDRIAEHGVPIGRIINGGGIPQKNEVLNQVYANVLGKPMLVPQQEVTSLGSAVFGMVAAGAFDRIESAQEALCPSFRVVKPDPKATQVYDRLFPLFEKLYFAWGDPGSEPVGIGDVLPTLREVSAAARGNG